MKRKWFPLLVAVFLIIGVAIGFGGILHSKNSNNDDLGFSNAKVDPDKVQVTVETDLKRPKKNQQILFDKQIKYQKGMTAFSALKKVTGKQVGYQNGATVYVNRIGKYTENDVHSGTGWKYYVNNGKDIAKAANLKTLKAGDHLYCRFVDGYK